MDLSAGSMVASLVVSLVAFAIFWYGRKQRRVPHVVIGILMMVFPYFFSSTLLILGVAALLGGLLWGATRFGL
jgi:D-alanyl-lipoteichoic acid acyltransferase DltB (MBOAT superfamily)